jgi:molybdate transport system substrate-binding protein
MLVRNRLRTESLNPTPALRYSEEPDSIAGDPRLRSTSDTASGIVKRLLTGFVAVIVSILSLLPASVRGETITVSAAISLKEALTDAAKAFEADTGDHVEFTFGASGQLAAQIANGAAVDLFISAAEKQVGDLTKAGLVESNSRQVVAGNSLVLIVPADQHDGPTAFDQLADATLKRLALGEPKTVPAGQYAMQVLKSAHVADRMGDRIVYGANVRQVLDYVERGEVTAGIVYATDARQSGDKVRVVATAGEDMHEAIVYPAVVLKESSKKPTAGRFLDYLVSEKGQRYLSAHGFTAPTVPASRPAAATP